jgi:hypothetical protein
MPAKKTDATATSEQLQTAVEPAAEPTVEAEALTTEEVAAEALAIEEGVATEGADEVAEVDLNFARFVSTSPEPGGFLFGPYIAGRLETGSKILCWHVPIGDVDNMLNHFYVTSGRVRLQDVKKLGA